MAMPQETPISTQTRRGSAKSLLLAALVVLNAALVLSLAGRLVAPNAAQATAA